MSLLLTNAFGHSYYLCWRTVLQLLSAATSHPLLIDRVIGRVSQLSDGSVCCDFCHWPKWHLCVFLKIDNLVDQPVRGIFPAQCVLIIPTRTPLAAHSRPFDMPRFRTCQFSRSFVPSCVRLWNGFLGSVFAGEGLGAFITSVNRFLLQD